MHGYQFLPCLEADNAELIERALIPDLCVPDVSIRAAHRADQILMLRTHLRLSMRRYRREVD